MALDAAAKLALKTALQSSTIDPNDPDAAMDAFIDAMATFITAADVTITLTAADVGLQTSTAVGTPTAGPAAPVNITGGLS